MRNDGFVIEHNPRTGEMFLLHNGDCIIVGDETEIDEFIEDVSTYGDVRLLKWAEMAIFNLIGE